MRVFGDLFFLYLLFFSVVFLFYQQFQKLFVLFYWYSIVWGFCLRGMSRGWFIFWVFLFVFFFFQGFVLVEGILFYFEFWLQNSGGRGRFLCDLSNMIWEFILDQGWGCICRFIYVEIFWVVIFLKVKQKEVQNY